MAGDPSLVAKAPPCRPAPIYTHGNFWKVMARRKKLKTVTASGTELEKLQTLALILAERIDAVEETKDTAQLARQYRETIRAIEELKEASESDDEVGEIITKRKTDGKPGAVRKSST